MSETMNASEARKKFYQIMDEVNFGFGTVRIAKANGNNAVILSEKSWQEIMETLNIMDSPALTRDIIKGAEEDFEDMKKYDPASGSDYDVYLSESSLEDLEYLKQKDLADQAEKLLNLICKDPFSEHQQYEKLTGTLEGFYSRKINIHHRLIYKVYEDEKKIKVVKLCAYY